MADQAFALPDGRIEIRCAPGEITHIVRHDDGRSVEGGHWTVRVKLETIPITPAQTVVGCGKPWSRRRSV